MAGYSGTPLWRKLGIRAGDAVAFPGAPGGFADALDGMPTDVRVKRVARAPLDVIVSFVTRRAALLRSFPRHRDALVQDGNLWIAWPKASSGVATDLEKMTVMGIGHDHGLVDNKVCAIDDTWSALRFTRRVRDRG